MSLDDQLKTGGGSPIVKFADDGASVVGTLIDAFRKPDTDLNGRVRTFADGTERTRLVVVLQTDDRDPSIEDDDGIRRVFTTHEGEKAIVSAVQKSAGKFDRGGRLALQRNGSEAPKVAGHSPTYLFVAKYVAPDLTASLPEPAMAGGRSVEDLV